MPNTPRYYALESLPELLGERQFAQLCAAMGLNPSRLDCSGPRFAALVEDRARSFKPDVSDEAFARALEEVARDAS